MTPAEIIARAYDREQAAQMGEPDPWADSIGHPEGEGSFWAASVAIEALQAAGIRLIGPGADDPATTIYGRLLHSHRAAAREAFDSERRKQIFDLIEAFRAEFPAECQLWDDRYAPATRALQEVTR